MFSASQGLEGVPRPASPRPPNPLASKSNPHGMAPRLAGDVTQYSISCSPADSPQAGQLSFWRAKASRMMSPQGPELPHANLTRAHRGEDQINSQENRGQPSPGNATEARMRHSKVGHGPHRDCPSRRGSKMCGKGDNDINQNARNEYGSNILYANICK